MDITLHQYSNRIQEISNNYQQVNFINLTELDHNLNELNVMLKLLNTVSQQIQLIKLKLNKYKQQDIVTMSYTDKLTIAEELIPKNKKNIICVENIIDIPQTPLYWVNSTKQYAINLGGMILRGNIGKIYNKNIILKNNNLSNIIYCNKGKNCPNILKEQYCKFYHDPLELLELKNNCEISEKFYCQQIAPKNFTNTSWIYTDYPEKSNNLYMRTFGSGDTLAHYIKLAKLTGDPINKSNYSDQTIHDILVLYALHLNGL